LLHPISTDLGALLGRAVREKLRRAIARILRARGSCMSHNDDAQAERWKEQLSHEFTPWDARVGAQISVFHESPRT
jgi:hypothetical protein